MTDQGRPDAEMALRARLRADTALVSTLTGLGATSHEIDLDPDDALPCVVIYRAGGREDPYLPIDSAAIGLDVWGRSTGSRQSAKDVLAALLGALGRIKASSLLQDGAVAVCWTEESVTWFPDPSGRPRYTILGVLALRPSALAA